MRYTARRRLFVSATAVFAVLMLAALAVITRDGILGAINHAMFGVLVVLWSAALTAFPFSLIALLIRSPKAARWRRSRSAEREDNVTIASLESAQASSSSTATLSPPPVVDSGTLILATAIPDDRPGTRRFAPSCDQPGRRWDQS
jgi:hypothetical protein